MINMEKHSKTHENVPEKNYGFVGIAFADRIRSWRRFILLLPQVWEVVSQFMDSIVESNS